MIRGKPLSKIFKITHVHGGSGNLEEGAEGGKSRGWESAKKLMMRKLGGKIEL